MSTALDDEPDQKNITDEQFHDLVNRNWSSGEQKRLSDEADQGSTDNDSRHTQPLSSGALDNEEQDARQPAATRADNSERNAAGVPGDQVGEGYSQEGSSKKKGKGKFWNRRRAMGGGVIGLVIGGTVAMFSVLHGPWQLIQLSKVLSKFSQTHNNSIAIRLNNFTRTGRAASTGDVGETRVTVVGSKRFRNVQSQLKDVGIEFERRGESGRPTALLIEADKNPGFRNKSPAQTRTAIANFYNVDKSRVVLEGGKFKIDMAQLRSGQARSLAFTTLKHLGDGSVPNAMNKRVMAKFFNIPSLFHPLERKTADVENKHYYSRDARKAREENRRNTRRAKMKTKYASAKSKIKEKVEPHRRALSGTLLVAAGVCLAREFANLIPLVNYGEVVVPSMIEAADKQAVGAQTQSNNDIDINGLGDVSASLVDDDGRSIWEAKSLNALARNNAGEGQEIEDEYVQAFSTYSSSGGFMAGLERVGSLGGGPLGDLIAKGLCSGPGLLAQGVVGLGLILTGPGGWAAKSASFGASTAATAMAIKFVQKLFVDNFAADAIKTFAGPGGGNLLAFGARAGHNLNARSMGGVALSGTDKKIALEAIEEEERKEFLQKSFFARVFDLHDYRSVASFGMRTAAVYEARGIASLFSKFNPLSAAANMAGAITPKILAQESTQDYDWGSPLYSVPMSLLENPDYEDPYENAESIAKVFNGDPSGNVIKRARNCFGVDIKRDTEGWDVIQVEDVNPTDDEYVNANCSNMDDKNWEKTIVFVLDTTIVTLVDCYEGNTASCNHIGGGAGSGPTIAGNRFVGDPYTDSSNVECAAGTEELPGLHDAYHDGARFSVRLCSLPNLPSSSPADNPGNEFSTPGANGYAVVNSRVSGAWLALVNDASLAGITLFTTSSYRSMAHQQSICNNNARCRDGDYTKIAQPGYSSHQAGVAIDFAGIDAEGGQDCAAGRAREPGNPGWVWLHDNAQTYGFKQYSAEAWHWDALDAANRCGAS